MWPFNNKKSISSSGLLNGWTDWHSHILPGVDDGIRKMEDSLKVLDFYEKAGVSDVWFTPHIMVDTPNETEHLLVRFEKFQALYKGSVNLHLASENMIDRLFEQRLEDDDLLPYDDKCLLVETSYFNPPLNLWEIFDRIRAKGYFPVLAHPERYSYMDYEDYDHLIQMDVEFQLNLPSVCGMYGREAMNKAIWLLKKGYYHLCGSDTHRVDAVVANFNKKIISKDIIKAIKETIEL